MLCISVHVNMCICVAGRVCVCVWVCRRKSPAQENENILRVWLKKNRGYDRITNIYLFSLEKSAAWCLLGWDVYFWWLVGETAKQRFIKIMFPQYVFVIHILRYTSYCLQGYYSQ